MTPTTDKKKFIHAVIDGNIGYFKFYEEARQEDYEAAFEDYMRIVGQPATTKLVVAVEAKNEWNPIIENLWIKTGEMAEQFGIRKWGVVTPDSAIRKMTLSRVVKRKGFNNNPKYQFLLSGDESEVLDWIKKD